MDVGIYSFCTFELCFRNLRELHANQKHYREKPHIYFHLFESNRDDIATIKVNQKHVHDKIKHVLAKPSCI